MIRAIVLTLFAFIAQIFLAAICVPFGLSGMQILVVPAALLLATTKFSLPEALSSMLLLGFLFDCWLGSYIGAVMAVLALLTFCSLGAIMWLGRPNYLILTSFIFFFSLAFRVCVALALGIQGGSQGNWEWTQIVFMPFLDVAFGLLFYRITLRVLTLFGLCEVRENTSQRLARRSPRIRLE
jgi:hypothetical protein